MKKRKIIVLFFISGLILFQCLPDRMPPSPIESQRPEFVSFSSEDSAAFAVPLRDPITMTFNEPMMLSSFADNFVLTSEQGDISGTFGEVDSTITFTPSEDMEPATIYTATVFGSVKDKNGNSLTLDENWKASTWFFTTGQYSENGFPLVFIADRSFDKLYKIGNFNELL
ncbi:MAG: hypothetical protein GWN00_13780, partial [Aliifodinibius sp.]|nr:Ig-like domain-containing protein [Fodinibius sp.]NIV12177.1 hypothetical protein [Fodinibius sp.]NIY25837.1 hypothetical protein [Fodinibius sp.]